jgi:hypothetical protein
VQASGNQRSRRWTVFVSKVAVRLRPNSLSRAPMSRRSPGTYAANTSSDLVPPARQSLCNRRENSISAYSPTWEKRGRNLSPLSLCELSTAPPRVWNRDFAALICFGAKTVFRLVSHRDDASGKIDIRPREMCDLLLPHPALLESC